MKLTNKFDNLVFVCLTGADEDRGGGEGRGTIGGGTETADDDVHNTIRVISRASSTSLAGSRGHDLSTTVHNIIQGIIVLSA